MIYTVTMNPAVDISLCVRAGLMPGSINKSYAMRTDPGGKGINVSKVLKALGTESVICTGTCGPDGDRLKEMLSPDFEVLSVDYPAGNTRMNIKIAGENGVTTDVNADGPLYDMSSFEKLKADVLEKLGAGDIVVISGSALPGAPSEIYADLIRAFNSVDGVRVILDASGRYLKKGIEACPYAVKPNCEELGIDNDPETAKSEAERIFSQYGTRCLISMGSSGAVYAGGNGEAFFADALDVKVRNTTGCGDAMTAGLAFSLENNMTPADTFRLCLALAAAEAETEGTDPPSKERIEELLGAPICGQ